MKNLVSIIIPTKNSGLFLENCLKSIHDQTYRPIEVVIVDGKSTDSTLTTARKYKCKIYTYVPDVPWGSFDASLKRNYGAKRAKGGYIYWMDVDMELPRSLIQEAVSLCHGGASAVILPEDSFGTGVWARAKNLERRCYWGDNTVECPRFFRRSVWEHIGGLDESLGAGGDDLDIHQKVLEKGYSVSRTKSIVMHNEGNLSLHKLFKKHFMYGRDTVRYFIKRPKASTKSYLFRIAYVKNLHLFIRRPTDAIVFAVMRSTEYLAGFLGFLYSFVDTIRQMFLPKFQKKRIPNIEKYARSLPQYYVDVIPNTLKKYLSARPFITLLDCGCGDGSLLYALKKNGYFNHKKIVAVDLSRSRIHLVKKIDKNIHTLVDDAEKLEKIKTNSIDFFISSYVIEHVDDKKMLATIWRVTKRNGIVYLSTVFKKWYGWYYYRKNGKWVMDLTHQREYTDDSELFNLIDKRRFKTLKTNKTLLSFPIVDFIIRRSGIGNRRLFVENPLFQALRRLTIPIPGYYGWEIVLQKL